MHFEYNEDNYVDTIYQYKRTYSLVIVWITYLNTFY